jgi:hypothetical protein
MPNKLSEDKKRISYGEWKDVYEVIRRQAKKERVDISVILRRATQEYVKTHQGPK